MKRLTGFVLLVSVWGCATDPDKHTLADLSYVEPVLDEVDVSDSLERAMNGYRQFLANTDVNSKTPEALRRLADLQIEKEYGAVVGDAPPSAALTPPVRAIAVAPGIRAGDLARVGSTPAAEEIQVTDATEPRTTGDLARISADLVSPDELQPAANADLQITAHTLAPRQAIATYQRILDEYPFYERNDQVLYQMARAYDELGEIEAAMQVMLKLVDDFPGSRYVDEVFFRRGEYFFVRRKYLDAEDAYGAILSRRPAGAQESQFHELALYKLGWTLYKQDLYEQALHQYLALLDYKVEHGYDFQTDGLASIEANADDDSTAQQFDEKDDERRVTDTFRVVSLAFSNLGGTNVLNEYFATNGRRSYENRVYRNLAEFYATKLRFNDAAEVYQSFVEIHPFHQVSPHFSMRIAEIYAAGGFPALVVTSKKDFAKRYGLNAEFWQHFNVADLPRVVGYLQTNLSDLAQHYHALYQEPTLAEEQAQNYIEAQHWYGESLGSFPEHDDAPAMNYRLADLHLEEEAFQHAALAYERTAYDYPLHDQSSAAGYAAIYAHRQHLAVAPQADYATVRRGTVDSSLRFSATFPEHEHAAGVLSAATDDLYEMQAFVEAIAAGQQLITHFPHTDVHLLQRAWTVVSHAHFDLQQYAEAEQSYLQVLALTDMEDEARPELTENLAAAIYQQGELARSSQDFAAAAEHFLRVTSLAPGSTIQPAAEYDAAVALIAIQEWAQSAEVLNAIRDNHADHELQGEVTKQLAHVYRQTAQYDLSAAEFARIAATTDDPALRSESLLMSGELYLQAENSTAALLVLQEYVSKFNEPLETHIETRNTIAGLLLAQQQKDQYLAQLQAIVELDRQAGDQRTARTRYLAANAALTLTEPLYGRFADMALELPFQASLAEKQDRMDIAMQAMESLVAYEVAEVTSAATFYMAEIYRNFSRALMQSERPLGMNPTERSEYDLVIEEEAFPFEERAIEVHEANIEMILSGAYNSWIERSLAELGTLMPARYDKQMASGGYIAAIDSYAYRSPIVDTLTAEADSDGETDDLTDPAEPDDAAAEILEVSGVF